MAKDRWTDDNYHKAYALAQTGLADKQIAHALGVSRETFKTWKSRRASLRNALAAARHVKDGERETFRDYVYDRLDPELQKLWDQINACELEQNGVKRIEALLRHAGKEARQHLFLYAFTASNFNATEACRKVNITRRIFDYWIQIDPEFSRLIDEIHWHKGNFFENALINSVDAGDVAAVLFANKTFNRDRGYGEKTIVDVNVSGQINHLTAVIKVDELNLPIEVRRTLLEALREKKQVLLEQRVLESEE